MIIQEVERVINQVDEVGYAVTNFEEIGLSSYGSLANDLLVAIKSTEQYQDITKDGRTGMLMYREDSPLAIGRRLIEPVVEVLFAHKPEAIAGLGMYAINHYEEGDFFRPHQDHFDGTVMIMTPLGQRKFDVYRKEEVDDEFVEIDTSYILSPGSILVLNGYRNLGHAATCIEGPSVSVVADVPVSITMDQSKE